MPADRAKVVRWLRNAMNGGGQVAWNDAADLLDSDKSRIERLTEALTPFANAAEAFNDLHGGTVITFGNFGAGQSTVRVGDLRRARAVLAETEASPTAPPVSPAEIAQALATLDLWTAIDRGYGLGNATSIVLQAHIAAQDARIAKAVADEREACAVITDKLKAHGFPAGGPEVVALTEAGERIRDYRARKTTTAPEDRPEASKPAGGRRNEILSRIATLKAENAAASGWGAAVGARAEEIKDLEGALRRLDAEPAEAVNPREGRAEFIGYMREFTSCLHKYDDTELANAFTDALGRMEKRP